MTSLQMHKARPVVFRLFLVTVLVAAHCCLFTMPAHAAKAGAHVTAHAAGSADAAWQVGHACCHDAPAALAVRAELPDDAGAAFLPAHRPFALVTAPAGRGHPLRAPPDPAPAPRALLQIFRI